MKARLKFTLQYQRLAFALGVAWVMVFATRVAFSPEKRWNFRAALGLKAAPTAQLARARAQDPVSQNPRLQGPLPLQLAPDWALGESYAYYARTPGLVTETRIWNEMITDVPSEFRLTPVPQERRAGLLLAYQDGMRPYLEKEKWSNLSFTDRMALNDWSSGFARGVVADFQRDQFLTRREFLKSALPLKQLQKEAAQAAKVIPVPIQVATAVVGSMVTGQRLTHRIIPEAELHTQIDLLNQRTQFSLLTQIVDTSFSLRGLQQNSVDPNGPPPKEFPAKNFRYEIWVGKAFPEIAVSTGLAYVNTTESLRATLSKGILPNLSAELAIHEPLNPGNRLQLREETLRVQYGLVF